MNESKDFYKERMDYYYNKYSKALKILESFLNHIQCDCDVDSDPEPLSTEIHHEDCMVTLAQKDFDKLVMD